MAEPLAATFRRPFAQQVAAFRLRLGDLIPTSTWKDVQGAAHDRGFMVAGAAKADLLADLAGAVDKAVSEGTTLDEFRRDFRGIVEKNGWHGWTGEGSKGGEAWRTKVIYQTNMRTSYAAGRHAQLTEGNFGFWVYRHGGSLEPRPQHLAWDGMALPPDHPFWASHYPPNGWGCSCYASGARTEAGVRRLGGDPDKALSPGWDAPDPRSGVPKGIDKGWAHAPGASVTETVSALAGKLPKLPASLGAAMFHSIRSTRAQADIAADWQKFVDQSLRRPVQQNFRIIGALKPEWVSAAALHGIVVESAEIAVTDKQIQHTFRGTALVTAPTTRRRTAAPKVSSLPMDWYRDMPEHLRSPQAVLLDLTKEEPVFLLVYDMPGALAKLVVEINTPLKRAGGVMNTVQTGRLIKQNDLATLIGRGALVIEGRI